MNVLFLTTLPTFQSKIKSVCSTYIALPSQSLIKSIRYPELLKFTNTATCWGCDHEKQVKDFYFNLMKQNHTNFTVCDSGFNILQSKPFIGAPPDGMVACDWCGEGTLEIKCPFWHRNDSIELAASSDKSFCTVKKAEKFFSICIMAELVGKFYSRFPGDCIDKSGLENEATEIEDWECPNW